ncbi:putative YhbY family RNA-binding protein [Weissella uvarum]|uniref:YhbY family RNA-binding protein n=1 Tax=Weissella uvarum TaxID=1479233 RepID=UPI00196020E6|nr:YhbY family RNA-binding protein [Weissella uvarum]MBM7616493.1 putative YhbY family RNA-binding protein [Weissella uvarum]MCM0595046.1 YhbY family RNA-binding protein [Weissella uvarum]
MELRGKQKRYLRAQAHDMRPLFSIGKQGMSQNWLDQLSDAIDKRELFKVNILPNSDVTVAELQAFIEDNSDIQVVQSIGHTLVLFGESKDKDRRHYSTAVKAI